MNPDGVQTVCSKRVMCTKTDDPSGKLCAMRQAVDGAPAFVYNEHNKAHRAWPGTGANSPQRAQCPLRGADTEDTNVTKKKIGVFLAFFGKIEKNLLTKPAEWSIMNISKSDQRIAK